MAYATLEVLAGRVRQDLEAFYRGRRVPLAAGLRDLLRLLLTAQAAEPLAELAASGEVRGLRTHLEALTRHLQAESQLPEAVCARYKYRTSEAAAIHRYGVSRRTWEHVHALARELDWDLELQVPRIVYEGLDWHDELEQRFVDVEVVLDARALEGMLIYALEGYLSPRKARRKGYEVYGVSLGMTRDVHGRKRRDGLRVTRYVSVLRSHPQLSAEGHATFVEPNPRSLHAILAATAAFYPEYQAVGDFHSHPYDELSLLEEKKGWRYSSTDEQANIDLAQALAELGHRIQVAFIIAIARCSASVPRRHYKGRKNTIQMSLGSCRVILTAYRSLGSGRLTDSNIRLRLSGPTS
jgi:hypothetical protein